MPRDFPLGGQCGIPPTAVAVSLNVTATATRGPGFLLLYPQGGALPLVSTLNYVAGETVANAALVPLGAGGGLTVVAGVSGTDLILDVDGYFEDSLVHDVGVDNTFVGPDAGDLGVTGQGNTAVGARALNVITTGEFNTAVGRGALASNTAGASNIAIGRDALGSNTDGGTNIAIGHDALFNTAGGANVAIGYNAGFNTTGNFNTAIGRNALVSNNTGSSNIALGAFAGQNLTTGSDNIHIGHPGGAAEAQTIRLGTASQTRAFIAGIRGVTTGSPLTSFVLIDPNGQLGTAGSSRRVKTDIEDVGERSRALHALRPVSFRYRVHPPDGPLEYGLIAEEVAEVYPALVVRDTAGAPETVRYHLLPALLLNELQRHERVLAEKDRQLAELAEAVADLTARLTRLEGRGPLAADHPAAPVAQPGEMAPTR